MIEVKGLNKTFIDGTKALKGLDLNINDGEILGLLGPNGAGKSTLIRILSTLSGFDDGKVMVAGHDIDVSPDKVRESIGVVAQNAGVDNFLTGRENMMLHGHFYKLPKATIEERIEELTGYFDIKDALDQVVAGYSGGMRRKLDIAMALIHKPKILFLDEPTLGLDIKSRKGLWTYITKLNKEMGLTILLTTHYLEEADKLSHRVAIINKGKIQTSGTPAELKQRIAGDSITLKFEEKPTASTGFEKALAETGLVKNRIWEGTRMHLYVDNGAESIPPIMAITTDKGLTITQLSLSGPTLDDVFLKYTGASLDDIEEDTGEEWWMQWAGKDGGKNSKWVKNWQQWENEDGDDDAIPDDDWQNNEWNKDTDSPPEDWQKWAAKAGYDVDAINEEEAAKVKAEPTVAVDSEATPQPPAPSETEPASPSTDDWQNNEWNKEADAPPDDWKKWAAKKGYMDDDATNTEATTDNQPADDTAEKFVEKAKDKPKEDDALVQEKTNKETTTKNTATVPEAEPKSESNGDKQTWPQADQAQWDQSDGANKDWKKEAAKWNNQDK